MLVMLLTLFVVLLPKLMPSAGLISARRRRELGGHYRPACRSTQNPASNDGDKTVVLDPQTPSTVYVGTGKRPGTLEVPGSRRAPGSR